MPVYQIDSSEVFSGMLYHLSSTQLKIFCQKNYQYEQLNVMFFEIILLLLSDVYWCQNLKMDDQQAPVRKFQRVWMNNQCQFYSST